MCPHIHLYHHHHHCHCHCHCHRHCHHHRHISWAEGRSSEHTLVTGQINALFFVGNFYPFRSNILVLSWNHDHPFAIWEAPKISILLCFSPHINVQPTGQVNQKDTKRFSFSFSLPLSAPRPPFSSVCRLPLSFHIVVLSDLLRMSSFVFYMRCRRWETVCIIRIWWWWPKRKLYFIDSFISSCGNDDETRPPCSGSHVAAAILAT